jgi:phage terminase small subunit
MRNSAFFGDRRSWYEIFAHNRRERYRAMSKPPSSKPPRIRNAGNRGGRPPKPVHLHKLEGTFQPVRHASWGDRLEAPGELSGKRPPIWMDDAQRKLWREVLADAPRGVLRRIDAVLFANYIELLDRYRRLVAAQRQLDRAQPMPFSGQGPRRCGGVALFAAAQSLRAVADAVGRRDGFLAGVASQAARAGRGE